MIDGLSKRLHMQRMLISSCGTAETRSYAPVEAAVERHHGCPSIRDRGHFGFISKVEAFADAEMMQMCVCVVLFSLDEDVETAVG